MWGWLRKLLSFCSLWRWAGKKLAPLPINRVEVVAVQENRLLNYYKAIEAKSAEMLAAAMQQNWDCMVECEKSCSVLIGELRMQSQEVQLTAAQRKEKTRIMQSILRNDAQIRMLAEPWLATLEYMGKMPTTSALH
ncbi:MAG: flagellar protein FliT [Comamonas sp.]|nr:flagellar protein FliT [Comamonas sp.]